MLRENPWCCQDMWSSTNSGKHTPFCNKKTCNSIYPIGWALGVSICQPIRELRKIIAYQENQNDNSIHLVLVNNDTDTEQIINFNEIIRNVLLRGRILISIK